MIYKTHHNDVFLKAQNIMSLADKLKQSKINPLRVFKNI